MSTQNKDVEQQRIASLVREVQKGGSTALRELIKLTQPKLMKFAFFLTKERSAAEDLCQHTFLKAIEAISTLNDPNRAMPWLYRILKNHFINQTKLASTQNETGTENIDDLLDPQSSEHEPEKLIYVRELVQNLDPDDRMLILLVHLEGFSYKEAADQVGLTEDAVRLRLHRARQSLIKKMESQ